MSAPGAGGAVSTEGTPRNTVYASRVHLNEREKEQIARQAAELLQEDMTVVLDAGTTCARLAQEIPEPGLRCTVITASWTAAEILSRSSDVTLQVTGGRLTGNTTGSPGFSCGSAGRSVFSFPGWNCRGPGYGERSGGICEKSGDSKGLRAGGLSGGSFEDQPPGGSGDLSAGCTGDL